MPNWCSNSVTFRHDDKAQIERMKTAFLEDRLLSEFVPPPEDLGEEWYAWNINNWGTKWEVNGSDDNIVDIGDTTITLYFDTAWGPPITFYENLQEQGWNVDGYYYESGMAFCGRFDENGDDYYEISGTIEEIEETLPKDINETFGITENMQMWEDENGDD